MGIASSILSIIALGVTILWWWLRRAADPAQKNRERYAQIDRDIARKNGPNSSLNGVNDLDELDRVQNGKGN